MADRVGRQFGNYRLLRLLGQGGFADAYLGEQIYVHTQAVVKVVQTQFGQGDQESFFNEARMIAHLNHPNIVRLIDFGMSDSRNTPYLIREYAPNGTLRQRHPRGEIVPLERIVQYMRNIAAALQYAHGQKVIHRDVKPENMLIAANQEILLGDFGIAVAQRSRVQSMTNVAGTVSYMAPEQIQGHAVPASDQYGLAAVIYEWLCGAPLFTGSDAEIASQHVMTSPMPLRKRVPAIPSDVEEVVLTALSKDPERRFGSVRAFAVALEQASQSTTIALSREGIQVFFSYARRDQNLRDQLENHLSNLKYRGLITTWHAREIRAGEETIQQIDIHLNTAHIVLLLISANFLASEYCYSREMMRALQRHERGEAHVIPVLLRPVLFTDTPFAKLQPLPTNRKPVVNWRNRDSAFVDIAVGIERVVQERLVLASPTAPTVIKALAPFLPSPPPQLHEPTAQPSYPQFYQQSPNQQLPYGQPQYNVPPFPNVGQPPPPPQRVPSKSRRGLILVALSLLGLLSVGVLLVQHPNLIPFVGVIVGSLILLAGILLAIRALVKRAQSRVARRREREQAQRRQLEEREREQAQRRQLEEARRREQQRREQQRQEERRREQEETLRRELEAARRPEQERAYYEKALAAYEEALHQNNVDATAYRGKGNALVGLERYDEALTAFEQALVLTPLPSTYVSVGNVLTTLGCCDEAVAAYEQALALDASYVSAYAGMSKALLQLGRTQEAEQAHERAKQLGDDD